MNVFLTFLNHPGSREGLEIRCGQFLVMVVCGRFSQAESYLDDNSNFGYQQIVLIVIDGL